MARGDTTHFAVTAYHEAGHALAALKCGRPVLQVEVSQKLPGNGLTVSSRQVKNPYDLATHPHLAWQHSYQTFLDDVFISLAGPIAEAKAQNRPLRSIGSLSDYQSCLEGGHRLLRLAAFVDDYYPTHFTNPIAEINRVRLKTRRWIAQPRTWREINAIAHSLTGVAKLTPETLSKAISEASGGSQLALEAAGPSLGRGLRATKARKLIKRHSGVQLIGRL